MSYSTVPAFVVTGYNDESRKHPTLRWLEDYTILFDAGLQSFQSHVEKYYTTDFTFVKPDGSAHEGRDTAWAALTDVYKAFVKYHHQPTYGICYDTDYGYFLLGTAGLFYTLPGEGPSAGAKDAEGKTYDGVLPGAFKFTIVKSPDGPDGLKFSKIETISDSGPVVVQLLQRGVLTPSALGL